MPRLTVGVDDDQNAYLQEIAESSEYPAIDSKSGAMRKVIDAHRLDVDGDDERIKELKGTLAERDAQIEDLENELDRARRERRQLLAQREENKELVEYVEEQRSIERRREERAEQRRSANMFRRAWWFMAGEPASTEE